MTKKIELSGSKKDCGWKIIKFSAIENYELH